MFILIETLEEYSSPIHYGSFDTFGAVIGRLFAPQSVFKVRYFKRLCFKIIGFERELSRQKLGYFSLVL